MHKINRTNSLVRKPAKHVKHDLAKTKKLLQRRDRPDKKRLEGLLRRENLVGPVIVEDAYLLNPPMFTL